MRETCARISKSVALDGACEGKCEVLEARAHAGSTHSSGPERCIGPELGGSWTMRRMREPTFKPKGRELAVGSQYGVGAGLGHGNVAGAPCT